MKRFTTAETNARTARESRLSSDRDLRGFMILPINFSAESAALILKYDRSSQSEQSVAVACLRVRDEGETFGARPGHPLSLAFRQESVRV